MSDLTQVVEQLDALNQVQAAKAEVVSAASVTRKGDVVLGKDVALVLLHKLATDDAFRSSYESNPANALAAVGVSAETIGKVSPQSLASLKLADKSTFAESLALLRRDMADASLCQTPPQIRLNLHSTAVARAARFAIPFGIA